MKYSSRLNWIEFFCLFSLVFKGPFCKQCSTRAARRGPITPHCLSVYSVSSADRCLTPTMTENLTLQGIYIYTKSYSNVKICWKVYVTEGLMSGSKVFERRSGSKLWFRFLLIIDRLDGNKPGHILRPMWELWLQCLSPALSLPFIANCLLYMWYKTHTDFL